MGANSSVRFVDNVTRPLHPPHVPFGVASLSPRCPPVLPRCRGMRVYLVAQFHTLRQAMREVWLALRALVAGARATAAALRQTLRQQAAMARVAVRSAAQAARFAVLGATDGVTGRRPKSQ